MCVCVHVFLAPVQSAGLAGNAAETECEEQKIVETRMVWCPVYSWYMYAQPSCLKERLTSHEQSLKFVWFEYNSAVFGFVKSK